MFPAVKCNKFFLLLLGLGAYLFLGISLGIAGVSHVLIFPGVFLFRCFSYAAFYIPFYFVAAGFLSAELKFSRKRFFYLNGGILPFFTLALFLKVLFAWESTPFTESLVLSMSRFGALLFLFALLLLEGGFLFLGEILYQKMKREREFSFLPESESKEKEPPEGSFREEKNPENALSAEFRRWVQKARKKESPQQEAEAPFVAGPAPGTEERKSDEGFRRKKKSRIPDFEEIGASGGGRWKDGEALAGRPESAEPGRMPAAPVLRDSFSEELPEEREELHSSPGGYEPGGSEALREAALKEVRIPEGFPENPVFLSFPKEGSREFAGESALGREAAESEESGNAPVAVSFDREGESYQRIKANLGGEKTPETGSPALRSEEGVHLLKPSPEPEAVILEPQEQPERKPASSPVLNEKSYEIVVEDILSIYPEETHHENEASEEAARILEETLKEFKIEARVIAINPGPVVTMFELFPAPGVKLSRIVNLSDNIAMRLAASRVRIVAPIPGKHAIGIEIPNAVRDIVAFGNILQKHNLRRASENLPIVLGKDIGGVPQIIDLSKTPHLLIAGATGSGKSVCVNSLICSLLYGKSHREVRLLMIDPKIVELKLYNDIPHLLTSVITDPQKALQALQWCLGEMERRYNLLDAMTVRDITSYNKKVKNQNTTAEKLPYLVVVIDEFADLMATSGKELEGIIARLAAMSRAVGIHLVLATQRPSIDVITGLIKANFPSRIAFMVAGKTDSRIIIDTAGAENLLGKGDMLFTSSWNPFPTRIQGAFLSEEEVDRVVSYVKQFGEPDYIDDEIFHEDEEGSYDSEGGSDPLFDESVSLVRIEQKASASYLQRRLKIGYNRAARLIEEMEHRGIVGPQNGSKAREVLF